MSLKLNLGSGGAPLPGYTNLDRKTGDECFPVVLGDPVGRGFDSWVDGLVPDESFDEVRASHILEHFPRAQVESVIKEWVRVLKPGGSLKIAVPNATFIAEELVDGNPHGYPLEGWLLGGQTDEDDFHKSTFTAPQLVELLTRAGLKDIKPWGDDAGDCASLPVSLNLQGTKPLTIREARRMAFEASGRAQAGQLAYAEDEARRTSEPEDEKPIKIVAVMSAPRVGFLDTFGSIQNALMPLGIGLLRASGVFWGQGLTRMMEMAVEDGADWILTLDYDSIFEQAHVHRLCQLMQETPDADAIVPVQVRREYDYSMFTVEKDGEQLKQMPLSDFKRPLTQITTGHFGLTLIRADALRKLKRPWFLAVPDPMGGWGEGRIEEDIYFWRNLRDVGGKVYLANEVRIGHLQLMVSWPDAMFRPRHQKVSEWQSQGQPHDCGGGLKVEALA